MDRRALPGLVAGLAGLAFGVFAALLASPALAVTSAACALAAGAASLAVLRSVRMAEHGAAAAQLATAPMQASETDESPEAAGSGDASQSSLIERPPIDPQTGLPDGTYFDLATSGRVAAARRHLWPVTVVLLELTYGPSAHDNVTRGATAVSFATLTRQTLRETDIVCRLSATSFGLILEDTSEEGAVWTVERLQIALAKDSGRVERLAAGVATYPTHGLRADELVLRAQEALQRACATAHVRGLGPVEVAAVDHR